MSGKHNSARRSKAVSCYETGLTGSDGFQTQSLEGIRERCLEVSKPTSQLGVIPNRADGEGPREWTMTAQAALRDQRLGRDPSLALGMTASVFRDKSAYGGSMARASG